MAAEAVGRFNSIDRAIRTFIHVEVEQRSLSPNPPRSIGVERTFVEFLVRNEVVEVAAYDLLERHRPNLAYQVAKALENWTEFGGRRPVGTIPGDPDRLVFCGNPNFGRLTGLEPVSPEVVSAYDWMARNSGGAFLLPSVCFLKAVGCDRIFATDATGDEGIDCIGRLNDGGLRATMVFVQAKSGLDHVSGDQFSAMHARFAGLRATPIYQRYMDALEAPRSRFGSATVFVIAVRGDFRDGARQLAWRTGTLLRPGRVVADVLGSHYAPGELDEVASRLTLPSGADLDRNLAPELGA